MERTAGAAAALERYAMEAVRLVKEGYGPGAWHGPDLRAALTDVTDEQAFWRPAPGRHNIAEIAAHHAWCIHGAVAQLTGRSEAPSRFAEHEWPDGSAKTVSWADLQAAVAQEQARLEQVAQAMDAGRLQSPLAPAQQWDVVLGVTCHAIYHAGQIQLIRRLRTGRPGV